MLQCRIESDLIAVEPSAWGRLKHSSAYLSYGWLRARSQTIKGRTYFILVSDANGRSLAGVPCYLVDHSSHPGYDPVRVLAVADITQPNAECPIAITVRDRSTLSDLRETLSKHAGEIQPALVVSAPGRLGSVSYAKHIGLEIKQHAIDMLTDAVERQAEESGARTVCWLYFPESEDPLLIKALKARSYMSVVVDAECYLPITWDSFSNYLAVFKSQRRRNMLREMATLTAAGVRVSLHGAEALTETLARLELQWRAKYGRQATLEGTLSDYAALRDHLGPALRVFVATSEDRPVGFSLFLQEGEEWYSRFCGFDYSANTPHIYFNLLFNHPIQHAIEHGVKCIRYSSKSYDAKRRRGCALQNLLAYVRPPDALTVSIGHQLAVVDRIQRDRFAAIAQMHSRKRNMAPTRTT